MKENFDTILEKVLEARDNGVSLQTLIEKNPEHKGLYADAWKFIEAFQDEIKDLGAPDQTRFQAMIESIEPRKSIISPWFSYFVPIGAVALVLIVVLGTNNPAPSPVAYDMTVPQATPEEAPALDSLAMEMTTFNTTEETGDTSASGNTDDTASAKMMSAQPNDSEAALASIENEYDREYQYEQSRTSEVDDGGQFSDLNSIYDDTNI